MIERAADPLQARFRHAPCSSTAMAIDERETQAASASGLGGRLMETTRAEGVARGDETLDGGSGLAETRATGGPPDEVPISPPDLFDGAYDLHELMGQGAAGEVWRARNVNLDKEVAIKLVKLQSGDPTADARLRNEARLAARISHPNVVGVYDTGVTADGRYYLVMELLEGHDLRELLEQRQALPAVEAVQILLPVLAGLDSAHRRKILHRDIKPENIFLARSDDTIVPKLVDFGIALARDVPNEMRATRTGALLGTPLYMAPEQARCSLDLDERTDIWAIATVLYELISGQVPFAKEDMRALFKSIAYDAVPPLDESLCDAELAAILERGLAKDPTDRWPSAREMADALVTWLLARGVTEDVSGDPLGKSWLGGSVRPAHLDSLRPSVKTLSIVQPVPPGSGAAPVRLPLSGFPRSLALVALGLIALALLALSERQPDPKPDVSASAAVAATQNDPSPPRVESVVPAPLPNPPTSESPVRPPAREREKPNEAPAAKTQKRIAPSINAKDDVPPAPTSTKKAPKERPNAVDPTWGF